MKRAGIVIMVVGAALSFVVMHDLQAQLSFNRGVLCSRSDGSLWRDASRGCLAVEDPRCQDTACSDSSIVAEGPRRSCSWLLWRERVPPTGGEPWYAGESPGGGCAA